LTLLVGRQEGHPACKTEWCGAGVVVCLEQGADNSMIYLNSMTYTLFFIPDYQFKKKYFYVIIFYCFCGGPWQLPSLPLPLKSGPDKLLSYAFGCAVVT